MGRILVGSDHRALIPFSMLAGALTFLLADTVGRTVAAPYEVSASIIMSVIGGPFFIILLRRSKKICSGDRGKNRRWRCGIFRSPTGKNRVLQDISLTVEEGKITTIMGANGCGKSTLFNLMTKNLYPRKGNIFLRGKNIQNLTLREFAKQVSIVHQYNTSADDVTVEQLVYLRPHPAPEDDACPKQRG